MTFRCAGCREYHRGTPHRYIGLSRVCSPQCEEVLIGARRKSTQHPKPSTPADTHLAVLDRDNWSCRHCGTDRGLHVHHIVYRSQGGTHDQSNLITLCHEHHALVHSDKRRWQPVCHAYINDLAAGKVRNLMDLDFAINGARPRPGAGRPQTLRLQR